MMGSNAPLPGDPTTGWFSKHRRLHALREMHIGRQFLTYRGKDWNKLIKWSFEDE